MKRVLFAAAIAAPLLMSACVVGVAPGLPVTVELGTEPYYYQDGYYYYYHNDRWSYSQRKTGPWRDLPRDRYPREVRRRGNDQGGDRRNQDRGRYRDRRD